MKKGRQRKLLSSILILIRLVQNAGLKRDLLSTRIGAPVATAAILSVFDF
ncbi:MAG: hypothetical protein QXY90_04135 [Candidatus Anstonellales archaeon]